MSAGTGKRPAKIFPVYPDNWLGVDESAYYGFFHYFHVVTIVPLHTLYNILMETFFVALSAHVAALFRLVQGRLASVRGRGRGSAMETTDPVDEALADLKEVVQLEETAIKCVAHLEILMFSDAGDSSAGNLILFLGFLLSEIANTFLLCFAGQQIIDESRAVCQVLCDIDWYKTSDPRLKKYISIFLSRCQEPITIKAGKYYAVSFEAFTAIMQASMSYFTFLQSVRT